METKSVSLILPMCNEIGYVENTVSKTKTVLESFVSDFEIIIVDDASNDGSEKTADILSQNDRRIKVIHHQENRKLGGALKTGFSAASKDIVIYTDMDMPFDFSLLKRFVPLLDTVDIVNGCRINYNESFKRRIYSKIYNALIRIIFGLKVRDVNFAMKIFKKSVIDSFKLKSEGSFISAELLIKAQCLGYKIMEIPVPYLPRSWGSSRLSSLSVIIKIIFEMIKFFSELMFLRLKIKFIYLKNRAYVFFRRGTCPFRLIEKYIPGEGSIYDLGCGHGGFLNYLSLNSNGRRQFVGFDVDNSKIRFASMMNKDKNISFEVRDITKNLGIVNASCIVIIDSLMFIPFREQEQLLRKCFNYLSGQGVLIIKEIDTKPYYKYIWHQFQETFVFRVLRLVRGKGIYCRKRKDYLESLSKIGYEVEVLDIQKGYFYPHILYICSKKTTKLTMKKILLLNPPASVRYIRDFYCSFSSKAHYYWPPQDLLALSGILSKKYEVEVLDAISSNLNEEACYKMIMDSTASAVIFTTGQASLEKDARFIERIKRNKDIKVIGSCSVFRFIGRETMEKFPFLDALLTDFTEKGIIDYLNGRYENCEYIIYRKGDDIYIPPKNQDNDFSIGIPLHEQFISKSNRMPIFGDSRFSIVVTSVGCIFRCGFCVAGTVRLRKRSLKEIYEELEYIQSLGIQRVFFVDPLFTADKNRVMDFCNELLNKGLKIKWACNAHAATLQDEGLLKLMQESGCCALLIGIESVNQGVLERYNKCTNIEQIKEAFRLCRKFKIKTLAYFIIGLGGDSVDSVQRTIKFAKDIKCDYASFGYATPDIGTDLRKESLSEGWVINPGIDAQLDPSLEPALKTNQLSDIEAKKLFRTAYRKFYLRPSYILKKILEIRSLQDFKYLFEGGCILLKKNIL